MQYQENSFRGLDESVKSNPKEVSDWDINDLLIALEKIDGGFDLRPPVGSPGSRVKLIGLTHNEISTHLKGGGRIFAGRLVDYPQVITILLWRLKDNRSLPSQR